MARLGVVWGWQAGVLGVRWEQAKATPHATWPPPLAPRLRQWLFRQWLWPLASRLLWYLTWRVAPPAGLKQRQAYRPAALAASTSGSIVWLAEGGYPRSQPRR